MEVAVTLPYTKCPSIPAPERPGSVARVSALAEGRIAIAVAFALGNCEPFNAARLTSERGSDRIIAPVSDDKACRKFLVLIVEADATLRDSLKAYLGGQGYNIIALDNASDAREVLNMLTPVLLIAEIEGEGLPGFDLCVHVKETPRLKHIPVMLMTGSGYPSDYSSAHSLGAVVCLAKPFRLERLGHVVRLLAPPNQMDANATPSPMPDAARKPKAARDSSRRLPPFGKLRFL